MDNELLLKLIQQHNRLIIPGFGALLRKENALGESFVFSPFLKKDDGVLCAALMDVFSLDSDEVASIVQEYVLHIQNNITKNGKFEIPGIGMLVSDANGAIALIQSSLLGSASVASASVVSASFSSPSSSATLTPSVSSGATFTSAGANFTSASVGAVPVAAAVSAAVPETVATPSELAEVIGGGQGQAQPRVQAQARSFSQPNAQPHAQPHAQARPQPIQQQPVAQQIAQSNVQGQGVAQPAAQFFGQPRSVSNTPVSNAQARVQPAAQPVAGQGFQPRRPVLGSSSHLSSQGQAVSQPVQGQPTPPTQGQPVGQPIPQGGRGGQPMQPRRPIARPKKPASKAPADMWLIVAIIAAVIVLGLMVYGFLSSNQTVVLDEVGVERAVVIDSTVVVE